MNSLVELLEGAAARHGDAIALGIQIDDGSRQAWSFNELERRSRYAAWRLRALGLQSRDRLLTWSPSMPELPALSDLALGGIDLTGCPTRLPGLARLRRVILGAWLPPNFDLSLLARNFKSGRRWRPPR